jgi:hypothetical protein
MAVSDNSAKESERKVTHSLFLKQGKKQFQPASDYLLDNHFISAAQFYQTRQ